MFHVNHETPLGALRLEGGDLGLSRVVFVDAPAADSSLSQPGNHPVFEVARGQIDEWFAGQRQRFELPLAPQGTAFQRSVWQSLGALEFGQTTSYGELAAMLGRPTAVRAVAAALGRNPLLLIVPCHRVIGRDGALTGYAGGLERKRALLDFEARFRPVGSALQAG
jgi:methylated-DNA-[protein]-cysteine S-methyltransferase